MVVSGIYRMCIWATVGRYAYTSVVRYLLACRVEGVWAPVNRTLVVVSLRLLMDLVERQ